MSTGPISTETIAIAVDQDVVRVRQAMRKLAVEAELSLVDQTKVVTAASELARNTLIYGGGGRALLEVVTRRGGRGVRVTFSDEGPGIADIDLALTDGFTTGNGFGLGLSGTRRLVDEFDLDSAPGKGTSVTITKWGR
ncbi:MAG TPA: anti-sigma regulatory factor [Jatrophihabitans sp.]|nr:anti-sigma regulatory factor [Jatrophihabitans sp.]